MQQQELSSANYKSSAKRPHVRKHIGNVIIQEKTEQIS